jgi:hypothetical protein
MPLLRLRFIFCTITVFRKSRVRLERRIKLELRWAKSESVVDAKSHGNPFVSNSGTNDEMTRLYYYTFTLNTSYN